LGIINLTIDEKEIEIEGGKTILEAALKNGIYIPHLCHPPDLKPIGTCGLCVVEQEGVVIVGDVLANRFGLSLPSRMFTVDTSQEIQSMKRLASLDFDSICFGHGPPILQGARTAVADFAGKFE